MLPAALSKWAQERESNPQPPGYEPGTNPIGFPAIMRPRGLVTWLGLRSGGRGESRTHYRTTYNEACATEHIPTEMGAGAGIEPATPSYGLGANPIDFPAIMRPQGRVTWLDLRSGSRGES